MKLPQNVLDAVQKQLSGTPENPKKGGRYKVSPKEERTADGIIFASKFEKETYLLFKKFIGLEYITLQQSFELQPGFRFEGKWHRAIKYQTDFTIHTTDGDLVVDTKGHHTDTFRMKEKMFIYKYQKQILLLYTKRSVMSFIAGLDKTKLIGKPNEDS